MIQRRQRVWLPGRMPRKEAGDYLFSNYGHGSAFTLAQQASRGEGPVFYKDGSRVFYLQKDLDDWARSRIKRFEPGKPPEAVDLPDEVLAEVAEAPSAGDAAPPSQAQVA